MARVAEPQADQDRLLLELLGDIFGLLDLAELRVGLIEALHRMLPSDWVSLNDIGPGPGEVFSLMKPDGDPCTYRRFQELAHENPILQHHQRTLDGRATRFVDVISRADLEALPLYREVYEPLAIRHQMAFTLPAGVGRVVAIALSRAGREYTDAERDLANRTRPYLIQAYLNAIAFHSLQARIVNATALGPPQREVLLDAGLTPREADAVRLLALGRSNHDIATELGISHRTVGKHLERSFRKLGVSDRSSAAGRVWALSEGAASAGPASSRVVRDASDALLAELPWGPSVDGEPLERSRFARQQPEREADGRQDRAPQQHVNGAQRGGERPGHDIADR